MVNFSGCNGLKTPFDKECDNFSSLFIEITNPMDSYNNVIDTINALNNEETKEKIEQLKNIAEKAEEAAKNHDEKYIVSRMADYYYDLEDLLNFETDNSKITIDQQFTRETYYHIVDGYRNSCIEGEAF